MSTKSTYQNNFWMKSGVMVAEKSLIIKMKTLLDCKIVSLTYSLEIFIKGLAEWSVFLWRCPVEWGGAKGQKQATRFPHYDAMSQWQGQRDFTDLLESIINNRKKNTTVSQDYLLSLSLFEMKCHMQLCSHYSKIRLWLWQHQHSNIHTKWLHLKYHLNMNYGKYITFRYIYVIRWLEYVSNNNESIPTIFL